MNQNSWRRRDFRMWNQTVHVEAGKFLHLTARAVWIENKATVSVREVINPRIVEVPSINCAVCVDSGWLVVIVMGPCEIPARATISVEVVTEVAHPKWLAQLLDAQGENFSALSTVEKVPMLAEGDLL